MATFVINAYSVAFPLITNRIEAKISTQLSPLAIIASQIVDAPHPVRIWSFPGLPRTNLVFQMNEIDGTGAFIRQLAYFDVVPGLLDSVLVRPEEQIQVDVTPGLVSGTNTFTFDGTGSAASTLELGTESNPSASVYRFTLKGIPIPGDSVLVALDFDLNDIDGVNHYEFTTVNTGNTLTDMINDLGIQILAINVNTTAYTDVNGDHGIRIAGFSSSNGTITITQSAPGGNKPNYIGWEISPEEYSGSGTLIRGVDYSWDKITGVFAFLIVGRVFQPNQWYTIEFEAQNQIAGGSVPVVIDFSIEIITDSRTLTIDQFGKKLIIEPSSNYIELTLPPISTVISGRYLMIDTESIQGFKCVQFLMDGSDVLKFGRGVLYAMMNESFYLYKLERSAGVYEWRICNASGNFLNAGQLVSDDLSNVFNKVLVDGGGVSGLDKFQYARIYNEVVLRLPVGQRVNYDSWSSNQSLYSLANSSDPSNADKFRIPNRLGLIEKVNPIGRIIGTYEPDSVGVHSHDYDEVHAETYKGPPTSSIAGSGAVNPGSFPKSTKATGTGISSETKMRNYSTNKYILA